MSSSGRFFMRERRRKLRDPRLGLFGTHSFPDNTTNIATDSVFPNRAQPITFAVDLRRTGAAPVGVVFEVGDATTGLAIWVPTGTTDVAFAAGGTGNNGVTLTANGAIAGLGVLARVVVAVIPGTGHGRLWINGQLQGAARAVAGSFPATWAASGPTTNEGAVGEIDGTVTARVPVGDRVPLADVSIVTPVRGFQGQRPQHFFTGALL